MLLGYTWRMNWRQASAREQVIKRPDPEPEQPVTYQIKVRGRLDESWSAWFDDMVITVEKDDRAVITTLTGVVADQAALHGLLLRVRDLGLPLLLVKRLELDHLKGIEE